MTKRFLSGYLSLSFLLAALTVVSAFAGPLEDGADALKRGDYETALKLLGPLADGGVPEAQKDLGVMYQLGHGVPRDQAQAVVWLRKSAEQGNIEAQGNLGLNYLYDHPGVARDIDQALVWMRKAADQGDIRSEITLANFYSVGMHVPKDAAQALAWYIKAAEQGDIWSQGHLGDAYLLGTLVPKDDIRAVYWLRKAADRGDGPAQLALGTAYAEGEGVPKDEAQALDWFRKAAEHGGFVETMAARSIDRLTSEDAPPSPPPASLDALQLRAEHGDATAQNALGILYADDHSTLKNYSQAAAWFRKAADQKFAAAERNLADLYFVGHGVPNDHTQFLIWLRRGADDGDPESQITLANMNFVGVGVVGIDNVEGVSLLRKAAEQGYAPAQVLLGRTYQLGQRTRKDPKQAALWFRKAGEQGNPEAEFALGQLYETGDGVPKDKTQALVWYRKAAHQEGVTQDWAKASISRLDKSDNP